MHRPYHFIYVTGKLKEDLQIWETFLQLYNGVCCHSGDSQWCCRLSSKFTLMWLEEPDLAYSGEVSGAQNNGQRAQLAYGITSVLLTPMCPSLPWDKKETEYWIELVAQDRLANRTWTNSGHVLPVD